MLQEKLHFYFTIKIMPRLFYEHGKDINMTNNSVWATENEGR